MKKLLLLFCLFIIFENAKSQSLANTEWLGTNSPSPNLFFRFDTDTLFYSLTSSGFTSLSVYTASAGQFTIRDLTGTVACTGTGNYNYSIAGNTLTFSLISDNCTSRRNTLVNYTWTLFALTDIQQVPQNSGVTVYPNPCYDGAFTLSVPATFAGKKEVALFDISGRKVFSENVEAGETHIGINFLSHGIYTGYLVSDSGKIPFIIIR